MVKRTALIVSILGIVLFAIVVGLQSAVAAAETAADPTATTAVIPLGSISDTTLYEESDWLSNGKGEYFFAGATRDGNLRRGLVKFDIAGNLPPDGLIISATLRLFVSLHPFYNPQSQPFSIHRLTADWAEGASDALEPGGSGASATESDATWTFSYFSLTPTERISWTNPGGDFLPSASATTMVGESYDHYTWGPSPGMLADLRHWLRYPDDNYGWIVLGNESENWTARRFGTRESSEPAFRPVLTVGYVQAYPDYLPLIIGR
jgi:hypothetical protein